jgi:predicted CoA-binding protein
MTSLDGGGQQRYVLDGSTVDRVIGEMRTVAVVGLSNKAWRPSYGVAQYLCDAGIRIVPVNPVLAGQTVLGEVVHASLLDIPREVRIDVVDIFRRSGLVPPIVDDAIARGDARAIWMQEGVVHHDAAARAQNAGLLVVMDLCLAIEHRVRNR